LTPEDSAGLGFRPWGMGWAMLASTLRVLNTSSFAEAGH
jgi:hypothetical protein